MPVIVDCSKKRKNKKGKLVATVVESIFRNIIKNIEDKLMKFKVNIKVMEIKKNYVKRKKQLLQRMLHKHRL